MAPVGAGGGGVSQDVIPQNDRRVALTVLRHGCRGQGFAEWGAGGQGGFLGSSLKDGAGSYPVALRVAPSPTEWTDLRGWPLLQATAQERGSPAPPSSQSKGLVALPNPSFSPSPPPAHLWGGGAPPPPP